MDALNSGGVCLCMPCIPSQTPEPCYHLLNHKLENSGTLHLEECLDETLWKSSLMGVCSSDNLSFYNLNAL